MRVSDAVVYVLNQRGKPLMPCSPQKATRLKKQGKAKVVSITPYTIQLRTATGESKQPIVLGVDSGYTHIGLSAISKKKELYASEILLRTDMVKLNSERRQHRRFRRYRKTWYRKCRFDNRTKPDGWLTPSIQHKLDSHIKVVSQIAEILPVSRVIVEVAAFDIQKIKDPTITSEGYQQGEQYGHANVREYVLYRDGHKCTHCHGRSGDKRLEAHHIESRQTGGDRPDNYKTLCHACHQLVSQGKLTLDVKQSKAFKAEAFMTMVRWKIVDNLRALGHQVSHTYGYITKSRRSELGLQKSHANDAFVIAEGSTQVRSGTEYLCRQVRKCNRKLRKGDRSHVVNTAPREVFGFRQWDKVLYAGKALFIKGRRLRGTFALSDITGKLVKEVSYKKLSLVERAKTLLIQRRRRIPLHPNLTVQDGVPCA